MKTWADQYLGAYYAARMLGAETVQKKIDENREYILQQPGGQGGLEACLTGLNACKIGMSETDVLAWADAIRSKI